MAEIILQIERPGLFTTLQDRGRPGFRAQGVPAGGALDRWAARAANYLAGNDADQPLLEITLAGPQLRLQGSGQLALTGGDLSAQLGGRPLRRYETVSFSDGQHIRFGRAREGCRAYLAIGGQWQTERWLGSCSALSPELTPHSFVSAGQEIRIAAGRQIAPRKISPAGRPPYTADLTAGVYPGPEAAGFSPQQLSRFFGQAYRLSPDCNRMGYRLQGAPLQYDGPELISSPVVPGTVQLPPGGQPILLLADAQTTGGYPRLAQVREADLDLLAQLRPGDTLRFRMEKDAGW